MEHRKVKYNKPRLLVFLAVMPEKRRASPVPSSGHAFPLFFSLNEVEDGWRGL